MRRAHLTSFYAAHRGLLCRGALGFFVACVSSLCLAAVPSSGSPAADFQVVHRRDSAVRRMLPSEVHDIHGRMLSSSLPVRIKQQGRQLCVTSDYNQLLPVYRDNGSFYTAFRITKGTNWLSGLPRGAYYINNRKFTIN